MNGILQVVQFLRDISVAMLHSLALLSPNVFIYLFILTWDITMIQSLLSAGR